MIFAVGLWMLTAAVLCILVSSGKLKIKLYLIIVTAFPPGVQLHTRPSRTGSCLCTVHLPVRLIRLTVDMSWVLLPVSDLFYTHQKHNLSSVGLRARVRVGSDIY